MAKKKAATKKGPAEPETPVEAIRRRIRGTCDALKQINYLLGGEEEEYNRLIRDGVYFFGHHPLKEVPALKAKFGRRRSKQKECFANAQEIPRAGGEGRQKPFRSGLGLPSPLRHPKIEVANSPSRLLPK